MGLSIQKPSSLEGCHYTLVSPTVFRDYRYPVEIDSPKYYGRGTQSNQAKMGCTESRSKAPSWIDQVQTKAYILEVKRKRAEAKKPRAKTSDQYYSSGSASSSESFRSITARRENISYTTPVAEVSYTLSPFADPTGQSLALDIAMGVMF